MGDFSRRSRPARDAWFRILNYQSFWREELSRLRQVQELEWREGFLSEEEESEEEGPRFQGSVVSAHGRSRVYEAAGDDVDSGRELRDGFDHSEDGRPARRERPTRRRHRTRPPSSISTETSRGSSGSCSRSTSLHRSIIGRAIDEDRELRESGGSRTRGPVDFGRRR